MKQKKLILVILAALVLLTAVLAIVHLCTRDQVPEGALLVTYNGKSSYIEVDKLTMTEVSGTVTNGKGEEKAIQGPGQPLFSLVDGAFQSAVVSAEDEYTATVGVEDADNAFLILGEDGSLRLVVFGDANAKRDVKQVVKVDFQ